MKLNTILIFSILSMFSCSKSQRDDCLTSLGETVSKQVGVLPFQRVYVEDRLQLFLVQDSSRHGLLELEGPKNLIAQVTSEVVDGRIELRNTNTCNFVRSFDYELIATLYVDEIVELTVESIAEVTSTDTLFIDNLSIFHNALSSIELVLGGNELFIESNNSASTILHGKLQTMKGSIEEISDLRAFDLECSEVLLDSHTPLDCEISASTGIFVNLYNTGNIIYSSEPSSYKIIGERTDLGNLTLK